MNQSSPFVWQLRLMRDQVAASDLLPKPYARYRPLLADGLHFFLERLSPSRLREIFEEQMSLPPTASTAERVVALLHHVPALHKLGQVVARDQRLDPDFRKRLQQLESLEPRTPVAEVARLVERELKGQRPPGIELATESLAEGSVAVVLPFVWRHSRDGSDQGVFKVLKPGIHERMAEDLEILGRLGDFLDEDCDRYQLPALDYRDTFDTIKELLLHEVHLEEEQQHMAEAARLYATTPTVAVPALFPFCSPNLTAMERIAGEKLANSNLADEPARRTVARAAAEALILQPLFSREPVALFHADPHAGNLLITPQNRVGILDWSLTGRLQKRDRIEMVQLLLGAVRLDAAHMARAVEQLAKVPNRNALQAVLQSSLQELRWGTFPGLAWLTELLDNLALHAGVKFDGQLLLFRKTLLTLEGVLADLLQTDVVAWQALLDEVLVARFLQHWTAEWPERFYAPLDARSFATHLSTADVASVLWSSPLTMARWWSETSRDVLQLYRKRAGYGINGPDSRPGAEPRHNAPAPPSRHPV